MSESGAKRILTVEDSDNIRKLIAYNLMRAGYEVLQASNGKEAVAVLQKAVPDLIILDVRMPEMNGFQLLELMRRYPKAAAIPVNMLTALSQSDNVDKALSLGVVDYLVKPLEPNVLLAKVREALDSSRKKTEAWTGPDRREFPRIPIEGVNLEPQPGGKCVDLSQSGIAWRTKSPPNVGDVVVLEADELFALIGLEEVSLRTRVVYVNPVGLGYHLVGAAFIGLSGENREVVRRFIEANAPDSQDGTSA